MFERLSAVDPEPKGELEYINPFTLLVAVVLSAQATDVGVNKATQALFAVADTPQKMLALGEAGLRELHRPIGLFRTKAKNVDRAVAHPVEQYGGEVPLNREALQALPGVGRKTASVVLNDRLRRAGHRRRHPRLPRRPPLGLATGKTPREVERELMSGRPRALPAPAPTTG